MLILPVYGPGRLTHAQEHQVVLSQLSQVALRNTRASAMVDAWRRGAKDDTVFFGTVTFAIYQHPDPAVGAQEWIEDYAQTMRQAGLQVSVAKGAAGR